MNWLSHLAGLGAEDLMRVSRLVELLAGADRASGDMARAMLSARPELDSAQDARERVDAVVAYLEQVAADDWDSAQERIDDIYRATPAD